MRFASSLLVVGSLWVALGFARPASARAPDPPPPPPPPLAALSVTGAALVRDAQLEVRCEDVSEELPAVRCGVVARFELVAVEQLELRDARARPDVGFRSDPAPHESEDHVWVDGAPLLEVRPLAPGQRVRVELSSAAALSAHETSSGSGWIVPAMRLRHLLFGGGPEPHLEAVSVSGQLIEGASVRVEGSVHVRMRAPRFVRVQLDGATLEPDSRRDSQHLELNLSLDLPWHAPSLLQPGGPLLALGARFPDLRSDGGGRFLLRVGYELGFTPYFFGSVAVESDFDSLMESVVLEAATPAVFILPGVAAGVGVVARQFGHRGADAALRLQVAIHLPVLGVVADFDYWPSVQSWTGTIAARFSL